MTRYYVCDQQASQPVFFHMKWKLSSVNLGAKTLSDYELRRRRGHRNNFDHFGFFNVHLNGSTRTFWHFSPIEMRPASNPRSRAQQRNTVGTGLPRLGAKSKEKPTRQRVAPPWALFCNDFISRSILFLSPSDNSLRRCPSQLAKDKENGKETLIYEI